MIIIYGKPDDCPQCGAARMLCDMKQQAYEYKLIGQDAQPNELTLMAGVPIRSAPVIFERDDSGQMKFIGSYKELLRHLTRRPVEII